uniref:Uncharacterized protein n=1 Tax=Biomphalaria glabrata TaxID=6526 RepID=A0A2C9KMB0_BIOGL
MTVLDQTQLDVQCPIHGKPFNAKKPILIGHDTEHIGGVGNIMSKIAASALIAWKSISDHIITARLPTNQIKTNIEINVPTEDAEDTINDHLYNQLKTTLDGTLTHDLILLMGDSKINPNLTGFEYEMGSYGSAENISDNGERLISLCASNSLSIGNIFLSTSKYK